MRHSFSSISNYESCALMYKLSRIEKKVTERASIMVEGSIIHNAVGLYNQHCLKKGISSDFDKWKEFTYIALEQESLDAEIYPEVLDMVKSYAESHEIDLDSVVGAEEKIAITRDFKECDWDDENAWFRGIIDFLQIQGNIAHITDWKTGWLMEAKKFQLEIYAWLVKKIYPQVTHFDVTVDYLRFEHKIGLTILDSELADIEKKILTKTTKIENDTKFEPNVGVACSYCGCWQYCSAMKREDVVFKMPENDKEAISAALELEKYTRLASEAKKVLKVYCDKAGGLIAGGREWLFNPSSKWVFKNIGELIIEAEKVGVDIFDILSIDNARLKKKMIFNEKFKDVVEKLATKKVTISFTSKKYKIQSEIISNKIKTK